MDNSEIEEIPIEDLNSARNLTENHGLNDERTPQIRENSIAINELLKWLQLGIVYTITFMCLILWNYGYVPIYIPIFPLIIADCKNVILSSVLLHKSEGTKKTVHFKEIIESLGTLLAKIFLLISFACAKFKTIYLLAPLFVSTVANFFIKSISYNTCQTISEILFIIFRIARLLTVISVTFKIDRIYDFSWSLTLWPVWSFIGILGIMIIGLTIYTIGACCTYKPQENSKLEIYSSCWLLSTCIGLLVATSFFCLSVSKGNLNFIPPLIFFFLFVFITSIFFKKLLKGLSDFLFGDRDPSMPTVLSNEVLPVHTEQISTSFTQRIRNALKTPPKTLVQLSSSYFKRTTVETTPKKRSGTLIVPQTQRGSERKSNTVSPKRERVEHIDSNANAYEVEKCIACNERYANAVILECGHGGICFSCAIKLEEESGVCHICRSAISSVVKILNGPGEILDVISDNHYV